MHPKHYLYKSYFLVHILVKQAKQGLYILGFFNSLKVQ